MAEPRYFVFDFDSTFVQVEALEELARITLKGNPRKKEILAEIEAITNLGIDEQISFSESLRRRLALVNAHRDDLEKLVKRLSRKVSDSIRRNRKFFRKHLDSIYVISAGFREFIIPIVGQFGIPAERVFANTFEFDAEGRIIGFDAENPLSQSAGKLAQMRLLDLDGDIHIIGDGYSDFLMSKASSKARFTAFTENVIRKSALENADHISPNFDEFLFAHHLPMEISFPKNRIKVLLLEDIHTNAEKAFLDEGYQVTRLKGGMNEDELCEAVKDLHILGIRSKTKVTKRVLEHANRLISVGAFCIGTNQIDLEECSKKGVAVFNAPFSNTRSVVELVIGEVIMLMRGITEKSRKLHEGDWDKSAKNSNEIRGKSLGIIGYGNIGSQLSVLAEALGMKVFYFDKVEKLALGNAQKCKTMKELLKKCDVVTIHVDGDPNNKNLFGEKEFAQMKDNSVFLNLSRGFVVDMEVLAAKLRSGKLRGAAVDVFPYEPKTNDERFESPLLGIENLILTPHIGGSTQEAQEHIGAYVPENIINYVNSGSSFTSVNFPNLQLPLQRNVHRLIHIHRNKPGILAQINTLLSQHKINIEGQYLKTNEQIGYVITDINKKYNEKVIEDLKKIEHTIKFRVLF